MVNGIYLADDYGAKGDGVTYDTTAVQSAIDNCAANSGGIVTFNVGRKYLIGTIYLRSNVTIEVPTNTQILGGTKHSDYSKDTGISPYYPEPLDRCLIYANGVQNVVLKGMGTIDGQCSKVAVPECDDEVTGREALQRPMLIRLENCSNVFIEQLTLKGSFSWCVHIKNCENVHANRVNVFNDHQDGFNIESSKEIMISDCNLKCGDDGIALTTSHRDKPLKDVTITNCIISSSWAAIRLGPLSKGNFENITVSNCIFKECNGGGIKLGMYEGAEIKNCIFSNIVMDKVTAPISMIICRWTDIGSTEENPTMMPPGKISNISFNNIRCIAKAGPFLPWDKGVYTDEQMEVILNRPDKNSTLFFHGYPGSCIRNITLSNIDITFPGGGTSEQASRRNIIDVNEIDIKSGGNWTDHKYLWGIMPAYGLYVRHINGLKLNNIRFEFEKKDKRPAIFCSQSENIEINGLTAKTDENVENVVLI